MVGTDLEVVAAYIEGEKMTADESLSIIYAKKLSKRLIEELNKFGTEYGPELGGLWGEVMLNAQINALSVALVEVLRTGSHTEDLVKITCEILTKTVDDRVGV